ncbi:MAG: HlyD family efflux transporter periplasmic adaptor subunit [Mucilaginibacter sp.]
MDREKLLNLKLSLTSNYNDLLDGINTWEQKYTFLSPFNGQVQFLKFWNENQYVQNAEELFTLIPEQNQIQGQVNLPSLGAGKVKPGQEVIIKLENYPYTEYGSVKGKVRSIALTPGTLKSKDQSLTNNYLVTVDLANGLKTNYNTTIDFKFELKGSAEIITKERRLGSRLFDNLKSLIEKEPEVK